MALMVLAPAVPLRGHGGSLRLLFSSSPCFAFAAVPFSPPLCAPPSGSSATDGVLFEWDDEDQAMDVQVADPFLEGGGAPLGAYHGQGLGAWLARLGDELPARITGLAFHRLIVPDYSSLSQAGPAVGFTQ